MKKVTEQDVIKEYKTLLNNFLLTTGSNKITREDYRKHTKYGHAYENLFGTFDNLKKTFSVDLPERKINKKVVIISSILPNTEIYEDFVQAMEL